MNVHLNSVYFNKPHRVHHLKSRGGCSTCKLRHVKCDEIKPACKRCIMSGQNCAGYENTAKGRVQGTLVAPRTRKFIASPYSGLSYTPGEVFKDQDSEVFFRLYTLQSLNSLDRSNSCLAALISLRSTSLILQYCCQALGALHRLRTNAILPKNKSALSFPYAVVEVFALEQYGKAIHLLRTSIDATTVDISVIRLACILLCIFESLQGRQHEMLMHLRNGLALSHYNGSTRAICDGTAHAMKQLGLLCTLLGPIPKISNIETCGSDSLQFWTNSQSSINSTEISHELDIFLYSVVNAIRYINPNGVDACNKILPNRNTSKLQIQLKQWYMNFIDRKAAAKAQLDNEPLYTHLIRAKYETCLVFLDAYNCTDETFYDKFQEQFRIIVDAIEQVLLIYHQDYEPALRVLVFDLGVNFILFATALKCRHLEIRRKALHLFRKAPIYEAIWNAELTEKVVGLLIAYEEKSRDKITQVIPEQNRICFVDIEQIPDSRTLRYQAILGLRPAGPGSHIVVEKIPL